MGVRADDLPIGSTVLLELAVREGGIGRAADAIAVSAGFLVDLALQGRLLPAGDGLAFPGPAEPRLRSGVPEDAVLAAFTLDRGRPWRARRALVYQAALAHAEALGDLRRRRIAPARAVPGEPDGERDRARLAAARDAAAAASPVRRAAVEAILAVREGRPRQLGWCPEPAAGAASAVLGAFAEVVVLRPSFAA